MREPQSWRERVVGALGAVIAVALVIGAVAGAVTYSVVRATGLDDEDPAAQGSPAARPPRSSHPAPTAASSEPSPARSRSPSPSAHVEPRKKRPAEHRQQARREKPRASHHARHDGRRPTLAASPQDVSRMGRVNLFGRYPGHSGDQLVVQRLEAGSWRRFPVSVTVRGGRFHTWVASGHRGPNRFRVLDPASGRASVPETFRVH